MYGGLSFIKAGGTFGPNPARSTLGLRLSPHVLVTRPIQPAGLFEWAQCSPQSLKRRGSAQVAAASASSRVVQARKRMVDEKAPQSRKENAAAAVTR